MVHGFDAEYTPSGANGECLDDLHCSCASISPQDDHYQFSVLWWKEVGEGIERGNLMKSMQTYLCMLYKHALSVSIPLDDGVFCEIFKLLGSHYNEYNFINPPPWDSFNYG
jgi:hypothetical protein